jgi:hypothetical protein
MLDFARRIGAVRGDRLDWRRIAEHLAASSRPELLKGPMTRGAGRPKNDDDWLAMEVHRVRGAHGVSVEEACQRISRAKPPGAGRRLRPDQERNAVPLRTRRGGKEQWTIGSRWMGINAGTLEQRYWRWRRAEKARQEKLAIEIP